jgi:serine/threonine protein phosphatase PrpC
MELTIQLGNAGEDSLLSFQVHERSDIGHRAENQDHSAFQYIGDYLVCALADGAGGHQGGEVAAIQAVSAFLKEFAQCPTQDARQLLGIAHQANRAVLEAQQAHPDLADMHTTLCVLVLNRKTAQATWLHVGDSRVYHFNNAAFLRRTKDHSVLQWMQDQQQPELSQARNALYTAIGEQAEQLQVDVSLPCAVSPGDWFLLCSDGLWEHFTDEELGLLGSNLKHDSGCSSHIHQLALSRSQGQADNLSSILVFVGEGCHSNG